MCVCVCVCVCYFMRKHTYFVYLAVIHVHVRSRCLYAREYRPARRRSLEAILTFSWTSHCVYDARRRDLVERIEFIIAEYVIRSTNARSEKLQSARAEFELALACIHPSCHRGLRDPEEITYLAACDRRARATRGRAHMHALRMRFIYDKARSHNPLEARNNYKTTCDSRSDGRPPPDRGGSEIAALKVRDSPSRF